jgi:hypothetical protein
LSWFRSTSLVQRSSRHLARRSSPAPPQPPVSRPSHCHGRLVSSGTRDLVAAAPSTREALCELKLTGRPALASHRSCRALCRARAPCAKPRCSGSTLATRRGLARLLWAAASHATLALCSRSRFLLTGSAGRSRLWAGPLRPLSAHGAGGKFNSFSIFKNDSNPFQLQKFISNSIFV